MIVLTIVYFTELTPSAIQKIKKSDAFIALVTENFVEDKKCLEECRLAEKLNKPMYAIVKDENAWEKIKDKFMWRKIFTIKQGDFGKEIEKDLKLIKMVNDA